MPDERVDIVIEGQDKLSPAARSASASLRQLERAASSMARSAVSLRQLERATSSANSGIKNLGTDAQRTMQHVGGMSQTSAHASKTMGMLSIGLSGMLQVMAGMAVYRGVTDIISGLGDAFIGFNARLEQNRMAFTTLLGSADDAKKMLKELYDFAARTPFEFPQLVQSTQNLLAWGFAAKDVIPIMTAIGDATSGLGIGAEGINLIIRALGQMNAATKVNARDMMQLTEAGIPAWRILADAMGKSTAEVMKLSEQGLIPAGRAIQQLLIGMEERFPRMMEVQSRTFQGLMSTLRDLVIGGLARMGEPFFEAGRNALARLVDGLSSSEFSNALSNITLSVAQFAAFLSTLPIESFTIKILAAGTAIGGFTAAISIARGALGLLSGALLGLASPMGIAIAAIGMLGAIVASDFGGAQAVVGAFGDLMGDVGIFIAQSASGIAETWNKLTTSIVGDSAAQSSALAGTGGAFHGLASDADSASRRIAYSFSLATSSVIADTQAIQGAMGGLSLIKPAAPGPSLMGKISGIATWMTTRTLTPVEQAARAAAQLREQLANLSLGGGFGGGGGGGGGSKAAEQVKELADYMREAGITAQSMAQAMVNAHPAVQMLALRITGLRDQLAAVNVAIADNEAAQAAMQSAISETQDAIRRLNDQLSAARQRLSDLNSIRLEGMGVVDDQIFAVEQAIKRLQYVAAGGVLGPGMMPDPRQLQWLSGLPTDLEGLQKALERIRVGKELTFDPQMRQLREALEPGREMPLSRALQEISRTKAEIRGLERQLESANETLVSQQAALKDLQVQHANLQAAASQLQMQISQAEQMQQTMTQAMMKAILWMIEERSKMENLGDESVLQAGIVDEKTKAMLDAFVAFSEGHIQLSLDNINRMVSEWQWARDEIDRIMAGMPTLPSPPITPAQGAPSAAGVNAFAAAPPRTTGAVYVTVNVAGNVATEEDLASAVRDSLLRQSRRNGGLLWS